MNLDFHYTDRNLSGTSRGGRGGAQRGAPANRGNTIAQRNLPRVGVVPSEQPSAPARTPETVDVVIVPSAQNRPTAPSLRYSCAPVFRMEGNDFPRLGAAGPSSVRNQPRPQLGTSNQPVVTTPASACTTASTNPSAQPSAKPSWFIDDDEQFPSHRPHPALAAEHSDLQPQSEATANIDEVEVSQSSAPVVEGSWGGAMRRPNSLSSIASTLTANAFPSLGAPAKPLPKNLPPNSAWAKNKLSFPQGSSSSAIVGCMVPERNTAKKKPLPKPDIWPEEEKLKPIGKKAKGNMGTEEKEENSARKKKNKKEKVKQQQQVGVLIYLMKQPANARVLETGSTDGKPATVGKRLQSNDKEPEATVTATESCGTLMTATAGSQKRSDNSEQQKAREKRKEAEPDQADPFPTLGGNTSDGKIESSEQPSATFATSFSQMLSSAFSSLIGGGSNCPPTETNTKQRDFGENEANEVEEFPSLGGNVQQVGQSWVVCSTTSLFVSAQTLTVCCDNRILHCSSFHVDLEPLNSLTPPVATHSLFFPLLPVSIRISITRNRFMPQLHLS
ncbi:unnamed protein product [Toxocara canis]|uniref:Uncharacterized protein n=1 Tax=Toxocara canis TaxID=6265 RepID=A0A3P7FCN9_TOXCA|nr:unnamed protein product [Toxocara canis]